MERLEEYIKDKYGECGKRVYGDKDTVMFLFPPGVTTPEQQRAFFEVVTAKHRELVLEKKK